MGNAFFCLLYRSWEPLDRCKILPRGVGTFSTPGQATPRIFQKSAFYIFVQYRLQPQIFAAQSRQIAELERPAYTPKRAERPTYWNGWPRFFERIRESRVIAFSVGKRRKTPKVTDLPHVEWVQCFLKKHTFENQRLFYIDKTIYLIYITHSTTKQDNLLYINKKSHASYMPAGAFIFLKNSVCVFSAPAGAFILLKNSDFVFSVPAAAFYFP